MTYKEFEQTAARFQQTALQLMLNKNSSYTKGNKAESPFHNFEKGVGMGAGDTNAQVAWSYMVKHLVALKDKVDQSDFDDTFDLEEKCKDIVNYVTMIYCMGIDHASGKG